MVKVWFANAPEAAVRVVTWVAAAGGAQARSAAKRRRLTRTGRGKVGCRGTTGTALFGVY
jgi:hypothetical protein